MTLRITLLTLFSACTLAGCGDDAGAPAPAVPLVQFSDAVPPALAAATQSPGGKCNMEAVNERHWGNTVHAVDRAQPIRITGWGVVDAAGKVAAEATFVRLHGTDGKAWFALATRTLRPDVGKYFSDPWLEGAGYTLNAEAGTLPPGDYAATVVMVQGTTATLCDSGRRLSLR
jgi:hypothetical protein